MRRRKIRLFILALCAFLIPLAIVSPARADLVLGFPNGLTGWSTPNDGSAQGDPGTVTASGGLATITESTLAAETDLFLNFTVPTGAQSLQFTLNSVFADSTLANNAANGYLPDAFGASLLDPNTLLPLVPTVDQTTDSFYTRDIVGGVTQGSTAPGVTVSPSAGTLGVISVDLSNAGLDSQSAEILFRLIGGTDPLSTSTVTISNVIVIAGGSVPEPASIIPSLTAVFIVAGVLGTRWRRSAAEKTERITS
jgi:hypothetical protein